MTIGMNLRKRFRSSAKHARGRGAVVSILVITLIAFELYQGTHSCPVMTARIHPSRCDSYPCALTGFNRLICFEFRHTPLLSFGVILHDEIDYP